MRQIAGNCPVPDGPREGDTGEELSMRLGREGLDPCRRKRVGFQKSYMSHLLPSSKHTPQRRLRALRQVTSERDTIEVYGAKGTFRPRHPSLPQPEKTKLGKLN